MTQAPEVNIPLLRKAVEWVESENEKPKEMSEWRQESYILTPADRAESEEFWGEVFDRAPECGTCYCVAGYVSQLFNPEYAERELVGGIHTADYAAVQLGLTETQADKLFWGRNDAEDVRRIAEEIAGEKL